VATQGTVWSKLIVFFSPPLDGEDISVEQLIPQLAVERFVETILQGPPGWMSRVWGQAILLSAVAISLKEIGVAEYF